MITVKDVAKRAKVSPGTVSNYLTGKRPVAEKTSQRIRKVIDNLGYEPNMLARSLVNRRTHTLGVIVSGLAYYGVALSLIGIEQEAIALGYSLLLTILKDPFHDDPRPLIDGLHARRVDGIIVAVPQIGNNYDWLTPDYLRRLPPLMSVSAQMHRGASAVDMDNLSGGKLATQHLLDLGRKKIGLVGIREQWAWLSASQRQDGWCSSLEERGMHPASSLIAEGDWSAASGAQALRRLLERHPDMDAVFAVNDQMAMGVLRAAHQLGRRVPDDLMVIGYDNLPESSFLWPSLSTIRQDLTEMGRIAVRQLHPLLISDSNEHVQDRLMSLIHPELIVRESTVGSIR